MSKRHPSTPAVATPTNALQHFLNTAELATLVPALPTRALQRVVAAVGLEDAGSLLICATGDQLLTLMDADLWRPDRTAAADWLDPIRFGRWLQVMVDADLAAAVVKLQELDQDLLVGALAHHIGVGSRQSAERRGLLESVSTWECGALLVWARRDEAWDAVSAILAHAQGEHPGWFHRVMSACRDLSYEHLEEASGFDHLAGRREQVWHDMAHAREERREAQGYVTRHAARAFLEAARRPTLDDEANLVESRAYVRRARATADPAGADAGRHAPGAAGPGHDDATAADVARLAELIDACDGAAPVRGLLAGGGDGPSGPASVTAARLAALASHQDSRLDRWQQELSFLSNCLMESGVLPKSRASESDAVAAAIATCDLGFESLDTPGDEADLHAVSPVSAFRLGWSRLHRDVGLAVASALLRSLGQIPLERGEFHDDIRALRRALRSALEGSRPWDIVSQLDAIAILDLATWSTLTGLLAECPVAPLGCLEPSSRKRLRVSNEVEFVSSGAHLRWVTEFTGHLTQALSASM